MHLHPDHKFLDDHHLVNPVISAVFHDIAGGKSLGHAVDVGFSHEFGSEPVVGVAVRALRIFNGLALVVIQRIL